MPVRHTHRGAMPRGDGSAADREAFACPAGHPGMAIVARDAGADGIAVNTLPGLLYDDAGIPARQRQRRVSGPSLLPIGVLVPGGCGQGARYAIIGVGDPVGCRCAPVPKAALPGRGRTAALADPRLPEGSSATLRMAEVILA